MNSWFLTALLCSLLWPRPPGFSDTKTPFGFSMVQIFTTLLTQNWKLPCLWEDTHMILSGNFAEMPSCLFWNSEGKCTTKCTCVWEHEKAWFSNQNVLGYWWATTSACPSECPVQSPAAAAVAHLYRDWAQQAIQTWHVMSTMVGEKRHRTQYTVCMWSVHMCPSY